MSSNVTHDFLPISGRTASDSNSNPRSSKMSTRKSLPRTKCDSYLNQSLTNVPSILSHFSSSNASVFDRIDRKSGSAGMPRPISYAVFCLKKKKNKTTRKKQQQTATQVKHKKQTTNKTKK